MTSKQSKPTTLQILRKANKAYSEEAEKFCRKYNDEKKVNSELKQELIKMDADLKASQMTNIQSAFALFKALVVLMDVQLGLAHGPSITDAISSIEALGIKKDQ